MPTKVKKTTIKKIAKEGKTEKTTIKKIAKEGEVKKPVKKLAEKIVRPKKVVSKSKKQEEEKTPKAERYIEAVGRRKTAVARVRFFIKGKKEFLVNNKNYQEYFPNFNLQKTINAPLEMMNAENKFMISIKIKGGGVYAQAGAARHGISRVLVKINPESRKRLKKAGFLTRDPRMRERKKFGLKRARRAPQWSKR